jgi:hypothetical protein
MGRSVPRRRRLLALAGLPLGALAGALALAHSGEAPPPAASATAAAMPAGLWVDAANPACSDAQDRAPDALMPFCSVTRAAVVAQPGDTVHIAPGRYRGVVRPGRGGAPDAPIRFVADGPGVVLDAGGAANAVLLRGTGDVQFEGMEITGGVNHGVWVEADRVRLSRVTVRANAGAGVQIKSGAATEIAASELRDNGRAGLLELAGGRDTRVADGVVAGNGRDGAPYNGDGIQLGGTGALIERTKIRGNGDSQYEHGVYTAAGSAGWLLRDNVLAANAGANVKAGGVGELRDNRITDGRWGLVVSDNPGPVLVRQNVVDGVAQHLVFLTAGTTAARATFEHNTVVQRGRSTTSGDASALFVNAADDLELRNNLVAYTGANAAGVSIFVNDATRLGRLVSDTNWWSANDAQSRHLAWNGSRVTLATWRQRTLQDGRSVTAWAPKVDADQRVTSTNWGAGRGVAVGLLADFAGEPRPPSGAVDIGAYNAVPVAG